jgi:hypothetical protein
MLWAATHASTLCAFFWDAKTLINLASSHMAANTVRTYRSHWRGFVAFVPSSSVHMSYRRRGGGRRGAIERACVVWLGGAAAHLLVLMGRTPTIRPAARCRALNAPRTHT